MCVCDNKHTICNKIGRVIEIAPGNINYDDDYHIESGTQGHTGHKGYNLNK